MKKLLLILIITLMLISHAWAVKYIHIGGQTSIISFLNTKTNVVSGIDYDDIWAVYEDAWNIYYIIGWL